MGDSCFIRSLATSERQSSAASSNVAQTTQDSQKAGQCESLAYFFRKSYSLDTAPLVQPESVSDKFSTRNSPSSSPPLKRPCAPPKVCGQKCACRVYCQADAFYLCMFTFLASCCGAPRDTCAHVGLCCCTSRGCRLSRRVFLPALVEAYYRFCGWRQNKSDLSYQGGCSSCFEYARRTPTTTTR